MIRLALIIAAPLVTGACGNTDIPHSQESTEPTIMDYLPGDLSAEQVVAKIVEAARDVHSLRRETETTVEWRSYERTVSQVWVQVGADYYSNPTFPETSDNSLEVLVYRGMVWKRDDVGRWISNPPPGGGEPANLQSTDLFWVGMRDEQRMALVVGVVFDLNVTELHRVADDNDAQENLIHLRGRYSTWTSFPAASLYPDQLGPDEIDPAIDLEAEGTIDLWVDESTFRVVRMLKVLSPVPQEHDTGTKTEAVMRVTTTISDFNEAALPGPLPE